MHYLYTLYTKILVCSADDAEHLYDISSGLRKGFFEEDAKKVAVKIATLIKNTVPSYLLCEWRFANVLANLPVIDAVAEMLIEKGVLTPPENGIGAEGCWMIIKK